LRWSLGLYGVCAASVAGACLFFFLAYVPGRRVAAIKAWQQELVLRAELRKMTLDHWAAGGMADAETLASFPSPLALIASGAGAAAAGRVADTAAHVREIADNFTKIRGYHRFALLDANLDIVIETGERTPLEPPVREAAAKVLAREKAAVDFHRHANGSLAVAFLARVGTGAMAEELGTSLRTGHAGRAVDFVVATGMVAEGDAGLLRVVLQNLLHNAWKFTGKRPRARIEVGCASEQGRTVYHVRDDGAGFDMRFAGKLFAPFQRLHSRAEFPGTGIGLATVQRIIHRHGGKVWATAEVGQGATFYFSLAA